MFYVKELLYLIKKLLYIKKHVIPKSFSFHQYCENLSGPRFHQDEYFRSVKCKLLVAADNQICSPCSSDFINLRYEHNCKEARLLLPAKLNAPISQTNPDRLKLKIQGYRLECKQLKTRLVELKESLETHSKPVELQLNQDFISLFSGCDQKDVPPFIKMFWNEQQKYLRSSTYSSVRYHPMIIKFCLSLAAKSPSAYSDLRYDGKNESGILMLPS